MDLNTYLTQLRRDLVLSVEELERISVAFQGAMAAGLAGKPSSLKMLPSFIGLPTGKERGNVVAIDFGGTNVRVLDAELDGAGSIQVKRMIRFPLIDDKAGYNYLNEKADAGQLFGYIASKVAQLVRPGVDYSLGHTFSFPCQQLSINKARLLLWTKEIKTRGVEGQEIGALLDAALVHAGLPRVKSDAIINDTVGTLLAAAYSRKNVDVASICGTGHNTCYLEPAHPLTGGPMIVNMESGNFDIVPQTRFDKALDAGSEYPGQQVVEKMISGYYLGEIARLILSEMSEMGLLPKSENLAKHQILRGADLDRILEDTGDLSGTQDVANRCLLMDKLSLEQRMALQTVITLLAQRSARFVASTFQGTLLHVDPELEKPHFIAIDGSLYEKMPGYAAWLQQALDELNPGALGRVSTLLAKDGSGIGAAIAAATAAKEARG
ncbi:MAG: hypothetical protein WC378_01990 [Opitutaceae bacterium]|jgi:hexokinase